MKFKVNIKYARLREQTEIEAKFFGRFSYWYSTSLTRSPTIVFIRAKDAGAAVLHIQ